MITKEQANCEHSFVDVEDRQPIFLRQQCKKCSVMRENTYKYNQDGAMVGLARSILYQGK